MRGFGFIFGGFPNEAQTMKHIKANNQVIFYFLGFIVTFVAGSYVQLKVLKLGEDEEEGDGFKNE